MSRTGDIGGGAKLLVWVGSFAIAIGAMYSIRKWRDHASAKEERVRHAIDLRSRLQELTSCLDGYEASENLFSSIAFRAASGDLRSANCESLAATVKQSLADVSKELGVEVKDIKLPDLSNVPDTLPDFCRWMTTAHEEIERLVDHTGGTAIPAPRCEPDKASLIAAPKGMPDSTRLYGDITLSGGMLVREAEAERTVFARTTDGTSWTVRDALPDTSRYYSWNTGGFYSITWNKAGFQVFADDNGTWQPRAKVRAAYLQSITATHDGAVVISEDVDHGLFYALRSTDGAKTFGAPVRIHKADSRDVGHWDLVTHTSADGSVSAQSSPEQGPARFEASILEPGAKTPKSTASLTWNEPGDGRKMFSCVDGDTIWTLIRGRHVVVSQDAGRSWSMSLGIANTMQAPHLWCTSSRLGIVDSTTRSAYVCDDSCQSMEFPQGTYGMVAMKLEPTVELLLGTELSEVHLRKGEPMTVLSFRYDGSLVRDKAYVMDTANRMPAIYDQHFYAFAHND